MDGTPLWAHSMSRITIPNTSCSSRSRTRNPVNSQAQQFVRSLSFFVQYRSPITVPCDDRIWMVPGLDPFLETLFSSCHLQTCLFSSPDPKVHDARRTPDRGDLDGTSAKSTWRPFKPPWPAFVKCRTPRFFALVDKRPLLTASRYDVGIVVYTGGTVSLAQDARLDRSSTREV